MNHILHSRSTIILLIFLLASRAPLSQELAVVVDGDTLRMDGVVYRLHGIDAPEYGQLCAGVGGGTWPCGRLAAERLATLVESRHVRCNRLERDRYGREVAICRTSDGDLAESMVADGFAWAFRRYSNDYGATEDRARARKLGVWSAQSEPAWEYRARRWARAAEAAPSRCPIKGNISPNGRIYHVPWSPWYDRTRINEREGERWFCDEAEAIAAGWRAPH